MLFLKHAPRKLKSKATALIIILSFSFSFNGFAQETQTRWPIPDWEIAQRPASSMSTPQCEGFLDFATRSKKFLTEGLVIIKDGQIQYEHYDSKYTPETPHVLWSLSKTITGALLGVAEKNGRISLDQHLNEFFPDDAAGEAYQKIKIKNLFYLDPGFDWDEYYSGNVKKIPVINMLYGPGHHNMTDYSLSKKVIPEGPGYKFNYSTGTPVITMGVLKKVYGAEYDDMPWKSLFNPLGMKNVIFERDNQGVFNGGASAFATPRDMAKVGYLYLNNGQWNGEEILSPEWIKKTLQVSPGYLSPGTVIRNITDQGVYGGSIWLNRAVKPGFGRPFPGSPENMFLGMGHYGQMIVVLPTQKIVIARTGYDKEYNFKIDEFVTRALSCFSDPNYPIAKTVKLPRYTNYGFLETIETLVSGLKMQIFQTAMAKSICSCHFVSGIDVKTCVARSNIPLANQLIKLSIEDDRAKSGKIFVHARPRWNKKYATATFDSAHPEFGCTLN